MRLSTIILAPVAASVGAWLLMGLYWSTALGHEWYAEQAALPPLVAWWAWPWDFPGAYLVERGAAALGMPAGDMPRLARPLFAIPRVTAALMLNGLIAAVPVAAVATALRLALAPSADRPQRACSRGVTASGE